MKILIGILRILGIAQIPDIIRDIKNFFFIRKTIAVAENTEKFKDLNLNTAWFGVTYTVINLPPEVVAAPQASWQIYVMDKLIEYDIYFQSIGLTEIVIPRMDKMIDEQEGIYAYGVRFIPLRLELDIWYILWTAMVWSVIYFSTTYFWNDILSLLW